jgi:large subunit ribosomal protein L5
MAKTKAQKPAADTPAGKKGKKPKGDQPKGKTHQPGPPPRLAIHYANVVRQKLMKEFSLVNPNQVPTLVKVVVNVGMGDAPKNPKGLDAAVAELGAITGQRPIITKARKAISNFSLREGMPIGACVTLRRTLMWEFVDRFINVAVPRIRDFRGLPAKSFDGHGNYTVGIKEQMVFPEVDYDSIERIHGMDVTFVTSAERDDMARALLRELGMPFRGEIPVVI